MFDFSTYCSNWLFAIVYTFGSIHWGLGLLAFLALPAWSIYDEIKKKGESEEFEAWDDF